MGIFNNVLKAGDRLSGLLIKSHCRPVINVSTATKTLLPSDSSAVVELARAAGSAITLPAASACLEGTYFHFVVAATLSGDCTITAAGSDTIAGLVSTSADGAAQNSATGATVITFDQSASAAIGNQVLLQKGSGTVWYVLGFTPATVGVTLA